MIFGEEFAGAGFEFLEDWGIAIEFANERGASFEAFHEGFEPTDAAEAFGGKAGEVAAAVGGGAALTLAPESLDAWRPPTPHSSGWTEAVWRFRWPLTDAHPLQQQQPLLLRSLHVRVCTALAGASSHAPPSLLLGSVALAWG